MTKIDIEAIAREAGFITGARDYADGNGKFRYIQSVASGDFKPELKRFAALLLEKAAQVCDGQVERWTDDRARYCASECAAAIRSMAAGMGG